MMSDVSPNQNGDYNDQKMYHIRLRKYFDTTPNGVQHIDPGTTTTQTINGFKIGDAVSHGSVINYSVLPTTWMDPHVLQELIAPVVTYCDMTNKRFNDVAVINVESQYEDPVTHTRTVWPQNTVAATFNAFQQSVQSAILHSRSMTVTDNLIALVAAREETCPPVCWPSPFTTTAASRRAHA